MMHKGSDLDSRGIQHHSGLPSVLCCLGIGVTGSSKSDGLSQAWSLVTAEEDDVLFLPLAGHDLQLIQVQVLFRHGARTPLHPSPILDIEPAVYHAGLEIDLPETNFPITPVRIKDGKPAGPQKLETKVRQVTLQGGCHASVLTTVGQKQMFSLGQRLKEYYPKALQLQGFSDRQVSIQSTHLERNLKSMRCVLAGLFGADEMAKYAPVRIPVRSSSSEDLFPSRIACPALKSRLDNGIVGADMLQASREEKAKLLDGLGLPPDTHFNFTALRDDLVSRETHGNGYPPALQRFKDMIDKTSARYIHYIYTGRHFVKKNNDVIRMGVGRLLASILASFHQAVNETSPTKLRLLAAHDTTMVPLLEVFGQWQLKWPKFGSNFAWELYRSTTGGPYYVRVLKSGKPFKLPYKKSPLITLSEFEKFLKPYLITQAQFIEKCHGGSQDSK